MLDAGVPVGIIYGQAGEMDILRGGTGVNSGAQLGAADQVFNLTGMFVDGGGQKNVLTWLLAQFMPIGQVPLGNVGGVGIFTSDAVNDLVLDVFQAGGKPGLVPGCNLADFDLPDLASLPLSLPLTGGGGSAAAATDAVLQQAQFDRIRRHLAFTADDDSLTMLATDRVGAGGVAEGGRDSGREIRIFPR